MLAEVISRCFRHLRGIFCAGRYKGMIRFLELGGITNKPVEADGIEEITITFNIIDISPGIRRCNFIICSDLTLVYSVKFLLTP
jgi:hypothetical protein